MLNWKKIQELDLKEVAVKTQLELDFLEALAEKNFAVLSRFNVKGFIKILNREYGFDFSDFNEEYEIYLNENNPISQTKSKKIIPKLDVYSQKTSSIWPLLIVFIILAIIVVIIYYFNTFKTLFTIEHNNTSTAIVDIIDQAQENLKSLEKNVIVIDNKAQELNQTNNNVTSFNQNVELKENEQNLSIQKYKSDDNQIIENENNNTQVQNLHTLKINTLKEAHFKTPGKIWIGLIDLKNFKKTSLTKEKDFNISLDKDQLILTGSGALTVFDEENKQHNFRAGNLKRFLVKDGKITNISVSEFIKLNKGKEW